MPTQTLPEALNVLFAPIVGVLAAQFIVLLGAAGYMRRVVRDHDAALHDHELRLREVEVRCAGRVNDYGRRDSSPA
jgi:hypothetical protein